MLIVFSVLHISIAVHFCCGEVAAYKVSLSDKKASCGMENETNSCPLHNGINSNCCHDKVFKYAVGSNYMPSSHQIKEINQIFIKVLCIPSGVELYNSIVSNHSLKNNSPPGNLLASAVDLSNICVFRL